jgi:hypothetical protein
MAATVASRNPASLTVCVNGNLDVEIMGHLQAGVYGRLSRAPVFMKFEATSADIGDKINTQVIQPLIDANSRLARSDFPDFNDPNKLGEGSAKVERLSNLIAIFQKPELDFSKNRAEHDDILGDAYEYLMRHFGSESGKSARFRGG